MENVHAQEIEALFNSAVTHDEKGEYKEAIEAYKKLDAVNHGASLYNLGVIYYNGTDDMEPNYKLALKYFKRSSKAGLIDANYVIGNIYGAGAAHKNQKINFRLARKYLKKVNTNSSFFGKSLQGYGDTENEIVARISKAENAIENIDQKINNKQQLVRQELKEIAFDMVLLIQIKPSINKNSVHKEKVDLLIKRFMHHFIRSLESGLNSENINSIKCIYSSATQIATDIKKYDDTDYKIYKDKLANIRNKR